MLEQFEAEVPHRLLDQPWNSSEALDNDWKVRPNTIIVLHVNNMFQM